jgi:AcrR family transcriptional regulator
VTERHKTRRNEILKTAIDVWSSVDADQRSLSILAKSCGMTKQGLYRYFRNKDEILEELHERLRQAAGENQQELILLAGRSPLPREEIIDSVFSFLLQHNRLIRLSLQEGRGEGLGPGSHSEEFYNELSSESGIPREDWLWMFHMIIISMWTHRQDPGLLKLRFRRQLVDLISHGIGREAPDFEAVFKEVEQVDPADYTAGLPDDRIGQSVLKLIEKKGISCISLQELADYAGIGKSSIYNYFTSKEEMLQSIFTHLEQTIVSRALEFTGRFNDSWRRIYGYTLFFSRFLEENPAMKVMITELRSNPPKLPHNTREPQLPEKLQSIFRDAIIDGLIATDFLDARLMLTTVNFTAGMDYISGSSGAAPEIRARRVFRRFIRGIQA